MERRHMKSGDESNRKLVKLEKDYPYGYGYPWPPKYYTCSFCQREFRSAQALGGHMNIHRRDRAAIMLRDHHSPDNNNPNPNNPNPILLENNNTSTYTTNPNPNPSNHYLNIYAHHYSLLSLSLSSLPPTTNGESSVPSGGVHHEGRVLINANEEDVKLDLELFVVGDQVKQDLDLELRLGI